MISFFRDFFSNFRTTDSHLVSLKNGYFLDTNFFSCLSKLLSKSYKSPELDFIYLYIETKFNTHVLKNENPPILSVEDNTFGACNQVLIGLSDLQKDKSSAGQVKGLNLIKSAIRKAVLADNQITIDRLVKLLLDFGKYKLALTAAVPNLENEKTTGETQEPTKIALYAKAIVQYNLYHSLSHNSAPEDDLKLLQESEEIFTALVEDNVYPNFNVSINLIKIRFLISQLSNDVIQFETFMGMGNDYNSQQFSVANRSSHITKDSILKEIESLNSKINALHQEKKLVSHIELARISAQLQPEKTYQILNSALKTDTIKGQVYQRAP